MKILVVFGSKSDENISLPLIKSLSDTFEVEYEAISAHRELEKLNLKMKSWTGDAVIAGAGLAAALPGVVAAMTTKPVFGVPVPSQFGGLDSFASIAQMPPGVPVITCGSASTAPVISFLKKYKDWKRVWAVHFVSTVTPPDLMVEIEKARALGAEKGLEVTLSPDWKEDAFNIVVVSREEEVQKDQFCLHMPFLPKTEIQKPAAYLSVLALANLGGLWVGVNNTRNAVQSVLRLAGQ